MGLESIDVQRFLQPRHRNVTHSRNQTLLSLVKAAEEPEQLSSEVAL
jgi:hypothetical protein